MEWDEGGKDGCLEEWSPGRFADIWDERVWMMALNCIFKPYSMVLIILLSKVSFKSLIIKRSL